jgi:hypothetical protein
MTAEKLFSMLNFAILPAWLLLVFAPRWRGTRALVHSVVAPAALALLYAAALYLMYTSGPVSGGFEGTQRALSSPWGLLAFWSHAVTLDLFVGAWQVRDARRHNVPHWAVAPSLILTLFYGPLGLALYFVVRAFVQRTLTVEESPNHVASGKSGGSCPETLAASTP